MAAVCDTCADRCQKGADIVAEAGQPVPLQFADYRDLLELPLLDAVVIMNSWETHLNLACDAMQAGKYVAVEVGGAYSVNDC